MVEHMGDGTSRSSTLENLGIVPPSSRKKVQDFSSCHVVEDLDDVENVKGVSTTQNRLCWNNSEMWHLQFENYKIDVTTD